MTDAEPARRYSEPNRAVLIGKESVGKSALAAGLTGAAPAAENVDGATVSNEVYRGGDLEVIDTPGITLEADTETTREALAALEGAETVVLVVPASAIARDLGDLLPLVRGRTGAVIVTHWDRVEAIDETERRRVVADLESDLGVPVVPVDARSLERDRVAADGGPRGGTTGTDGDRSMTPADGRAVRAALAHAAELPGDTAVEIDWDLEPPERVFDRPYLGSVASALVLLLPAVVAVWFANAVAAELDPRVGAALEPAVRWTTSLPGPLAAVLGGDYGLLAMGPFLFVWALPTMLIFALFTGAYAASGLMMRVTTALHPIVRRVGLTGRDLVRVVMGFGCNVPAVTSTRACSDCTRCTTISAVSFGAACSYQFPATLAVFAAVGMPWLVGPYLAVLVATTLLYVRLIAPPEARTAALAVDRRTRLERPRPRAIWREARSSLASFVTTALPVFAAICVVAALLEYVGALERLGAVLEALSPVEVLVAVYLAGVLLPCLVTAITVAREVSVRFVAGMLARQAAAAVGFAFAIAWTGRLLF
ncbi:50S ribosome-binding GTPase [Haloterrigena salifodinae]|uniref:50S ribosome-binding GTPase n=1 Tax=Haloterrigena salifodinae TaxID=2675099 RepID=A0A8T8E685_9EURY|nr:nucleoside recognition domain-containing protein [Haloterrigena salifodinae]QRV17268.1 50S ribosome-binding GTPase [Haloterrigena salifodinae]